MQYIYIVTKVQRYFIIRWNSPGHLNFIQTKKIFRDLQEKFNFIEKKYMMKWTGKNSFYLLNNQYLIKNKKKTSFGSYESWIRQEKNPEAHFLHIKYLQHHIIVKKHCNSLCLRYSLMIHDDNVMNIRISHSLYVYNIYILHYWFFFGRKREECVCSKSR